MRKTLLTIALPLLTLGFLRLAAPPVLFSFAGLDAPFALLALALPATVLLLTSPWWERIDFRPLFGLGAALCLGLTLMCLYAPTFWGFRDTYISALDVFISLEGAILLALASLEKKVDALPVLTAVTIFAQLWVARFHKAIPAGKASPRQRPRYS